MPWRGNGDPERAWPKLATWSARQ